MKHKPNTFVKRYPSLRVCVSAFETHLGVGPYLVCVLTFLATGLTGL